MAYAENEQIVALILDGKEAEELKYILMNDVDWTDHDFGGTAQAVYNALDDADVSEA